MIKNTVLKNTILIVLLLITTNTLLAQKKVKYDVGISSSVGTEKETSFWIQSNRYGLVPEERFGKMDVAFGMDFNQDSLSGFDFKWQASGVAYTGDESKILPAELYWGMKWNFIHFYVGLKNDEINYNGLSSTNGEILYSGNARSYPKYEISVPEWTDVPFTKGLISFKGLLSDGVTTDDRYIENARIHHKNLYVRILGNHKLSFSGGIDHCVLWSGTHPEHGKISGSLDKYFKLFFGEGDDEGTFGNDAYRLGNHIGSYHINAYYKTSKANFEAYYQSVFEDGSGRKSESFPDALYGLYYENKQNEKAFVKSVLMEFYHTTDQSGAFHGTIDGVKHRGRDNYFNHGEYLSGWTHYGRTIGSPLFTASQKDGHAIIENNRFKALHLGVCGLIGTIPYKTYFTFSKNYGTYASPYESSLNQFSSLIELTIPAKKIPFKIDVACALDKGDLLQDNLGFYIRLSKSGLLK